MVETVTGWVKLVAARATVATGSEMVMGRTGIGVGVGVAVGAGVGDGVGEGVAVGAGVGVGVGVAPVLSEMGSEAIPLAITTNE